MTDGSEKTYLTCAETAKLVRKALKDAFPGVKFSVRSSTYSGGASITVGWTDGPTSDAVSKVTGLFSGADFDGMIDLKVYATHWLHPDGTVTLAKRPGTTGSFTEVIGDPVGPSAKLVHFGADFVFTRREVSDEWREEILSEFERVTGKTIPRGEGADYWSTTLPLHITREGELLRMVESDTQYVNDLVHRYTATHERP
jgi:conjugative element/phage-associated large polyvalent protein